jgi:hypothetical protein
MLPWQVLVWVSGPKPSSKRLLLPTESVERELKLRGPGARLTLSVWSSALTPTLECRHTIPTQLMVGGLRVCNKDYTIWTNDKGRCLFSVTYFAMAIMLCVAADCSFSVSLGALDAPCPASYHRTFGKFVFTVNQTTGRKANQLYMRVFYRPTSKMKVTVYGVRKQQRNFQGRQSAQQLWERAQAQAQT